MQTSFSFDSNDPILLQHFPGNPIVPAAILLDQICQTFTKQSNQVVHQIKQVRFNMPVLPSRTIDIDFQRKNESEYRFIAKLGEHTALKGLLKISPHNDIAATTTTFIKQPHLNTVISTAPIYERLPHTGNVCLIDEIEHWNNTTISTYSQVKDKQMLYQKTLSAWAGLEYAAQSLALHGVLLSERNTKTSQPHGAIKTAMIMSIKSICINPAATLTSGSDISTHLRILAQQPHAANCEFSVMNNGIPFCHGVLNAIFIF